mmetsp:Transcript_58563/g.136827  ORF Transcript_58563/g.136827 Transcript_58563/m.136827 type:complete len:253 (-) Transcript_58563:45-803(-)
MLEPARETQASSRSAMRFRSKHRLLVKGHALAIAGAVVGLTMSMLSGSAAFTSATRAPPLASPSSLRDAGRTALRAETAPPRQKKTTARYFVRLLKDDPVLGEAGDIVKVRRGRYRNELLPQGIAEMIQGNPEKEQQKKREEERQVAEGKMKEAYASKDKIESGKYVFEKKLRSGSNKIYGSLTPNQVADEIKSQTGEVVRLKAVQVPKIIETGKYSCTVEVGKNVNAYLEVEIIGEGTRDGDGDEEDEGED